MAKEMLNCECKTYLRIVADKRYLDDIEGVIAQFTPYKKNNNSISIGENEDFDVDVNVMIRKTLTGFFGREQLLLGLRRDFSAEIYLVVVPQIVADSDEPRQILSLDSDVIEFLYKAGVKYDLDYYVL